MFLFLTDSWKKKAQHAAMPFFAMTIIPQYMMTSLLAKGEMPLTDNDGSIIVDEDDNPVMVMEDIIERAEITPAGFRWGSDLISYSISRQHGSAEK